MVMLKPSDPGEKKPAAFRRKEQVDRWLNSTTDQQPAHRKEIVGKVKFDRGTVFLAACGACDQREVEELLRKGVDPDTANVDGLTGLHQACIDDRLSMVECLVENGAQINVRDNEGWTPLHATASCGYIDVAGYLLDNGADISACNADGDLPIDLAEGVDMENLLAAAMNMRNINADAARKSEETSMLNDANWWIQNPDIPEYEDLRTRATALHVAAVKGYHDVVKALLKAGADVNHQDVDGWTPLHAAAHWGQEESCRLLLEAGCATQLKDRSGLTALEVSDRSTAKLLKEMIDRIVVEQKDISIESVASGKRRTSITRMSGEEKDKVVHISTMEEKAKLKMNEEVVEQDDMTSKDVPVEQPAQKLEESSKEPTNVPAEQGAVLRRSDKQDEPQANRTKSSSHYDVSSTISQPNSWRASLRKAGSSSAVPMSSDPKPSFTVTKSASTSVVVNDTNPPQAQSVPLRTERADNERPFAALREQALADRSSYPLTVGRSQYIPYYKRLQMEREAKQAKEGKEAANMAAASIASSAATPERRSRFETPQRDTEAEANRKIKAKRARETRRSTQGVTQDDVKAAEATLKIAETGRNHTTSTSDGSNTKNSTTEAATVGNADPPPSAHVESKEKAEEPTRRRGWGRSISYESPASRGPPDSYSIYTSRLQEEGRSSSFRKARDTIISGGSTSSVPEVLANNTAYSRYRNGEVGGEERRYPYTTKAKEEEEEPDKDSSNENEKKPRLLRSRRNRRERRSTGVINYDEQNEKNEEEKEQDTSENRTDPSAHSRSPAADSNSSTTGSPGWGTRPFTRRYGSTSDVPTQMAGAANGSDRTSYNRYNRRTPTSDTDYKTKCEELTNENRLLKEKMKNIEEELQANKSSNLTSDRRERRALERRVSELEEEVAKMEALKADNTRLKEENGALIRVISKLSK